MAEHALAPLAEIPKGEGRNFMIAGQMVAVFRTQGDQVFACQAVCPHLGGPLADGMLGAPLRPALEAGASGATIICPLHDRTYDLATGKALVGECDIAVFPARLDGDTILVSLG